jgi:hypothetical protein
MIVFSRWALLKATYINKLLLVWYKMLSKDIMQLFLHMDKQVVGKPLQ